jgi:cyanate lyase
MTASELLHSQFGMGLCSRRAIPVVFALQHVEAPLRIDRETITLASIK